MYVFLPTVMSGAKSSENRQLAGGAVRHSIAARRNENVSYSGRSNAKTLLRIF